MLLKLNFLMDVIYTINIHEKHGFYKKKCMKNPKLNLAFVLSCAMGCNLTKELIK